MHTLYTVAFWLAAVFTPLSVVLGIVRSGQIATRRGEFDAGTMLGCLLFDAVHAAVYGLVLVLAWRGLHA